MIQFDRANTYRLTKPYSRCNFHSQRVPYKETVRKLGREGLSTVVLRECQDPADLFMFSARVIVGAKKRKSKKKEETRWASKIPPSDSLLKGEQPAHCIVLTIG